MKNILIVSPCYNVQTFIQEHINSLLDIVPKEDILLINDGSTDATKRIIEENGIQLISWSEQKGKAAALKAAFSYASKQGFKAVITIDSDLQHQHKSIYSLAEKAEKEAADIVIARREFSLRYMPLARIVSNYLSSKIISSLVDRKIYDSQCGLRYIGAPFLNLEIESDGFQFESEHLIRSCWNGASVEHIHTETIYNHSKSAMKHVQDTLKFARLFQRLYREKRQRSYDSKKQIS